MFELRWFYSEKNIAGREYTGNFAAIWIPFDQDRSVDAVISYLLNVVSASSVSPYFSDVEFFCWCELEINEELPVGSVHIDSKTIRDLAKIGLALGMTVLSSDSD